MRIPTATYRLQVHHEFTFLQAKSIVNYLAMLGISDAYLSPIFRARAKSTHGYDVLDLNQINPELGGGEGLEQLSGELRAHDMGLLQDIVPNHMAFDGENAMLMDVLEKGPDSRYYRFFDVNWNHPDEHLRQAPFPDAWQPLRRTSRRERSPWRTGHWGSLLLTTSNGFRSRSTRT